MAAIRGLGKGYSALFNATEEDVLGGAPVESGQPIEIDISLIDNNPDQPRKIFDEEAMKELAISIREYGILQPILLTKNKDRYVIVAGERRFRAAVMAGVRKVPALIRDFTPQQRSEIALIENLQREDLNIIEAARAIKELMENHGLRQEDVADRIGKSRPYVSNTIRLLGLPQEVIDMVIDGRLTAGHAKALVAVEDKAYLLDLAKRASDNKMSVRMLEDCVRTSVAREALKQKNRKKPPLSLELKEFNADMKRVFATKVKIIGNDKKGRICIDYYNEDDLGRIHDIIEFLKDEYNKY